MARAQALVAKLLLSPHAHHGHHQLRWQSPCRVDLGVPQDANGKVTDDSRARAIVRTVNRVLSDGGSAILMSLGRPKGKVNPAMSLKPVAEHLATLLGKPVLFATDCVGPDAKAKAAALKPVSAGAGEPPFPSRRGGGR